MNRFMQGLIIGTIIGLLVGGTVVYAASRATLVKGDGTEIGTTANPIVVQFG